MTAITRYDLSIVREEGGRITWESISDEEFDRIAREQGYVKRSECFDVWASTPLREVRIELEADDE